MSWNRLQPNVNFTDKNSPEYLNRQLAGGRYALVLILCFTAVNLFFLLTDSHRFFLFSASVPYYLTLIGKGMDNGFSPAAWTVNSSYTYTALSISLAILAVFLLLWFLSRKHSYSFLLAELLFLLDTFALITVSVVLMEGPLSVIMDLFIHGWVIFQLSSAVRAARKLKKLEEKDSPTD